MSAQTITPAAEPLSETSATMQNKNGDEGIKKQFSDVKQHQIHHHYNPMRRPSVNSHDNKYLYQLLKSTKVEELAQSQQSSEIVVLHKDETIMSALKKLLEVGVVSAPVVHRLSSSSSKKGEKQEEEDEEHGFEEGIGLIDTLDIMAYIVDLFTNDQENKHRNLFDRLQVGQPLASMTIGSITDFSHNPFTPIQQGTNLFDAMSTMLSVKAHRCPIVDKNGRIINVLTQAALVNFLARHTDALSALSRQHVGSLKLGTRPCITVPKTMRAIDAFKEMHDHRISGLGVIDASGILIGNLSARDLKHLDANNIHSCMHTSASSFIQRVRANIIDIVHPAISCTDETELGFVIGRLATNRIHRLYICDKELKPVGVISLRDVLSCVLDKINDTLKREQEHEQPQELSSSSS